MASDRNADILPTLDRILRERLEQFDVAVEVRNELRNEILAFFQRPEIEKFGATIMTPEASMAADQARKSGRPQPPGAHTPKVI